MTGSLEGNPFAVQPDALTLPFWEAAKAGEFRLPRCDECGRFHFYPRPLCPFCGSHRLSWPSARPDGRLVAVTHVHRPLTPWFEARAPYVLAIAMLDDGPAFFARIAPGGGVTQVGDRVAVCFEDEGGAWPLPLFRPAAALA